MYMLSTGAGRPAALAAASTRCRLQATASAEHQFNIVDVISSRSRAELFAGRIDTMFDWVKKNEPSVQP